MDDTISRKAAIDIFDDYNISVENGELEAYSRDRKRLCELPPAQPDDRLAKIAGILEGTIDHFDLEDAMDVLYQIKDALR